MEKRQACLLSDCVDLNVTGTIVRVLAQARELGEIQRR